MNYISYHPQCIVLFKATNPKTNLVFNFSPFSIQQKPYHPSPRGLQANFSALLGVKIIKNVPFLVVAAQSFPCCTIPGQTIYQIRKIEWIPIISNELNSNNISQCQQQFQQISKLFQDGHHYYCERYEINKPFHLNTYSFPNQKQAKFYNQFIWNQGIMTANGQYKILEKWCKPIIQGYVDGFSAKLPTGEKILYNIISRRSNKKAGTRYYARGIDDKGSVANFTETEQLIFFKDYTISQLQIRGSVPAFFQQLGISGLNGQLQINRNEGMTKRAFELHFEKLKLIYDKILCANLLSIKKPDEEKLTVFFQTLVDHYAPNYVKYQYFDFHQQCKNNNFSNSSILIQKILPIINNFGYYIIDHIQKKVINRQKGVIRTNCMDCLDRTNYIQSRVALQIFEKSLGDIGQIGMRQSLKKYQIFQNKMEDSSDILKKFNNVWAENGDSISLHYTGIGSTHTDITKTGKRTFKGTVNHKMRSLMRFFTQFTDTRKHQAIHNLVSSPKNLFRTSSIVEVPEQSLANVAIFSYQIADSQISGQNLFTEHYIERKKPMIIVVGGYIHTSSNWFKQIFKGKKSKELQQFMNQKILVVRRLGYQIFVQMKNSNSCLLIFGNQAIIRNLTQIQHQQIETFNNNALVCKFYIYRASMVFSMVNCHSFSGLQGLLQKSFEEAFQKTKLGKAKSSSILEHQYRTVLGNIGSTNKIKNDKIQEMEQTMDKLKSQDDIKNQLILNKQIMDADQFYNQYLSHPFTKDYMEGPINFIPRENRIIFWNRQSSIIKVIEYERNRRKNCIYGLFGYDISQVPQPI